MCYINIRAMYLCAIDRGKREDYTEEDVEYYFNYMGMLAEEGSYDSMEKLMQRKSWTLKYSWGSSCIEVVV